MLYIIVYIFIASCLVGFLAYRGIVDEEIVDEGWQALLCGAIWPVFLPLTVAFALGDYVARKRMEREEHNS